MTTPAPQSQDAGQSGATVAGTVSAVLAAAEAAIAAYMLASYTKWLAEVVSKVLGGFLRFGVGPDPTGVWATTPTWERFIDGLMDHLVQLARAGWLEASRQLGLDLPFNPDDPILKDQLQRTRNLMVRTPDEVYRLVVSELSDVTAMGGTREQQVEAVKHILDVTGTQNWTARAKTVATTEVHRTWNFGALAASMRAQVQLQIQLNKRWMAKDDSATRPGHARADGQTVPVNQPFMVNMEALMAPGDPSGSPSNVINCRCKPLFTRRTP